MGLLDASNFKWRIAFSLFLLLGIQGNLNSQHLEVKMNNVDSEILDMVQCRNGGYDKAIIVTAEGNVFRSRDNMQHFENIQEQLVNLSTNYLQDTDIIIGEVVKLVQHNKFQDTVVLISSGQVNWITEDCGESFKAFSYNKQRGYIDSIESKVPEGRIYWIEEIGNQGAQIRSGLTPNRHLFVSDDFFVNKLEIMAAVNGFHILKNFFFVIQLSKSERQHIELKVGNPLLKEMKLRRIQIEEKLDFHKFTILDASEGQVFVNINHLGSTSPMGTLYISDSTGLRFSRSLLGQLRTNKGAADFQRIEGVYGVFIANVYEESRRKKFERAYKGIESDEVSEDEEEFEESKSDNLQTHVQLSELAQQKVQTMITFDKGGIWSRIPFPDNHCRSHCFLNIHLSSSQKYNSFYSSKKALGLVLANGNVGEYLLYTQDTVNTYLSRDAGLTWKEIQKGASIFEIGAHGSVIVIAKDKDYQSTQFIEYSLDEGETWKELQISETDILIDNIITAQHDNTSTIFMVIAHSLPDAEGKQTGMEITIDFTSVLGKSCRKPEKPGSADSDYEKWIPHGYSSSCLLGKKITYSRRRSDAMCINTEEYEGIVEVELCRCTEEDWECDYGYARGEKQGYQCLPDGTLQSDQELLEEVVPEPCNGYYSVSNGYRLVPQNECQGGVEHQVEWRQCPGRELFAWNQITISVFLVFIIVLLLALTKFRKEFFIWIKDAVQSLKESRNKDLNLEVLHHSDEEERDLLHQHFQGQSVWGYVADKSKSFLASSSHSIKNHLLDGYHGYMDLQMEPNENEEDENSQILNHKKDQTHEGHAPYQDDDFSLFQSNNF